MDKIAVLIPCYNEAITIKKVVEDFKKALPEAKIYVYDNKNLNRFHLHYILGDMTIQINMYSRVMCS